MKRMMFVFVAAALLFANVNAARSAYALPEDPDDEMLLTDQERIDLLDLLIPDLPGPVSMIPTVEAWKGEKITVKFNRFLADVTVSIYNEDGTLVAFDECNTGVEWKVAFDLPAEKGSYYIYIAGDYYEGKGFFEI